ncbi:MAG: SDR family oxidoreductase [Nodosilinea sp.]
MQAFVTGSTGLLGSNLVRCLVQQGYSVKALVRSIPKAKQRLGGLDQVEFVEGDLQNVPAFALALKGCDVLFHAGAYFREYYGLGDHWPQLKRINIQATVELFEAAAKAGVGKVIYVSSSGCIGLQPDGSPGNETSAPGPITYRNLYFKSKLMAEQAVAQFLEQHPLPVVLILPGAMAGPGDAAPTELGQFVLNYLQGKIPALLSGGMSIVDVRDVADAVVTAVERGQVGQRYLVGGTYYSMAHIMQTLESVSGVPAPKGKLPGFMMRILAWISTWVGGLTGRKPEIPQAGVAFMLAAMAYDSTKAQRELGTQFRPLAETLADMVTWYRQEGFG